MAEVARRGSPARASPGCRRRRGGVQDGPRDRLPAGTCATRRRSSSTPTTGCPRRSTCRAEATVDDVARAYLLAWELGCLGITVFRDGCKGEQVLNAGLSRRRGGGERRRRRPTRGRSSRGPTACPARPTGWRRPIGTAFVTVNDTGDGEPFEVFVQVGKAGSDTMAVAEALGRLVSLVLRLPSPLSAAPARRGGEQPARPDRRRAAHGLRTGQGAVAARRAGAHAARASSAPRGPEPAAHAAAPRAADRRPLPRVRPGHARLRGRVQEVPVLRLQRMLARRPDRAGARRSSYSETPAGASGAASHLACLGRRGRRGRTSARRRDVVGR